MRQFYHLLNASIFITHVAIAFTGPQKISVLRNHDTQQIISHSKNDIQQTITKQPKISYVPPILRMAGKDFQGKENKTFVLKKGSNEIKEVMGSKKKRGQNYPDTNNKFSFFQRIESVKAGIIGLFAGGFALAPLSALHDIGFSGDSISNGMAQWEFDTDTGSIGGALFAIVYRYCVREGEEKNEMLPMGVVGAFVITRTLARVRVSPYCDAVPLSCGEPLGYLDYDMLQQTVFSGLESVALFGGAAFAMEYCYKNKYLSRFE